MSTTARPLGRRTPTDFVHVERFPLGALPEAEQPVSVPIALGINWYRDFDKPVKKGARYYIGLDATNLGAMRGGHCVCLKSTQSDPGTWWSFYDQLKEGACVGFGSSRMMSLLNRKKYNAWWLWDQAKLIDEWNDTNPGDSHGTSVRAAMDILRTQGHVPWKDSMSGLPYQERDALAPVSEAGISANRWATKVEEVLRVLNVPLATQLGAVPILNSWGQSAYPHIVWMPGETLQRMIDEDGEVALITDR